MQKLGQKHAYLKWDNPMLSSVVTSVHELVQCLHHTTVYELNCILLLIGDCTGRIIMGMWIKYDAMIKSAHQISLDIANEHRLKWAHKDIDNLPNNLEALVKNVIDANIADVIAEIKLHHEIINSANY